MSANEAKDIEAADGEQTRRSSHCYASYDQVPDVLFEISEDSRGVPFRCAALKWWSDGIFGWMDVLDGDKSVVSVGIHIGDDGRLRVGIYDAEDQLIYVHVVDA